MQPDTLIPGVDSPQAWNRFSYVGNNPIRNNDPTGHMQENDDDGGVGPAPIIPPVNHPSGGGENDNGGGSCTQCHDDNNTEPYVSFDGGWNYPQYSTWNLLRMGSPCAACHVTHWTGTIPKNGEIDSGLVNYYRSLDSFSKAFHAYALSYTGYAAGEIDALLTPTYSRYMSTGELASVQETGFLRGGRPGDTYFTTDQYITVSGAESKLALPSSPEVRVDFTINNNPSINGPQTVLKNYGQTGGGSEFWSSDEIFVDIVNILNLFK